MIEYNEELDQYSVDNDDDSAKVLVEEFGWEPDVAVVWITYDSD